MARLDELVAGITVGTATDAAAEAAFHRRLEELVQVPMSATLAGESVTILAFEELERPGRFRAKVRMEAGVELHAAIDSLDLSSGGPALTSLSAAYRHWLGYPNVVLEDDGSDTVSNQRIEARIRAVQDAMAAVVDELDTLNFAEIEQWVGDDDPWGRNKDYWSDGAYRYLELVAELASLQAAIDEIASTGRQKSAAGLSLELLEALQAAGFEYWHHYDVEVAALGVLERWLSSEKPLGLALHEPTKAVAVLMEWIAHFDLKTWLNRLVVGVDLRAREVLLSALVSEATALGPPKGYGDNKWAGALRVARLEYDEVDELLDDLPVAYWSSHEMDKIFEHLATRDDPQRSLELAEQWLRAYEEREGEPAPSWSSVRVHHRAFLSQLGRGAEAIGVLLDSLKARPSADHFLEIEKLAGDTQPEVVEEALGHVAKKIGALLGVTSKSPSPAVAKHVATYSVDALRVVSSRRLEPAASALLPDHPEAAANVFAALGCRHVDRGKGKYYHLAHDAFETARDLYLGQGRKPEWDRIVVDVVSDHGRKYSFMPTFRRIAGLKK